MQVFCGGTRARVKLRVSHVQVTRGEPCSPIQTRSRSDKDVADAKLVRNLAKRRRLYTV